MNEFAIQLQEYRNRGALIDTNLLLLYFLGSFERRQILSNKRLAKFAEEDFDLLARVLGLFTRIVTTPNILTEVSNLSDAIPEKLRSAYFSVFGRHVSLLTEEHVPSIHALESPWARFGLTDAAIAMLAKGRYLVITEDFRLSQALSAAGIDSLNFNHIRYASWQ